MTATLTTNVCRGCGKEIPAQGRNFPRKWCARCAVKVPAKRKGAVDEAEMEVKVAEVAARARERGMARPAPEPMTVRHDPSIVRAQDRPAKKCRGCRKLFVPTTASKWFCPECRDR